MVNLLKTFGKGILYIIGFPFFLVALLLFGVVGLFLFAFQLIKSIIYFFTGQKFFPELPEDKELRLRKEAAYAANNPQNTVQQQQPRQEDQSIIYPFVEQEPEDEPLPIMEEPEEYRTVEEACFKEPEPELENDILQSLAREEPQIEEPEEEPVIEPEETTLETSVPVQEEEPEEVLEEYVPAGTNYESDYEEENADIGVDIDYDVR